MNQRSNKTQNRTICRLAALISLCVASTGSAQSQTDNPPSVAIVAGPVTNTANGHKYFLLEPSTWTNAESAAVAMGGHLVTISDEAENSWVYNTFGSYGGVDRDLWIGLFHPIPSVDPLDPTKRSPNFAWASGHPVTILCWAEPPYATNGPNPIFFKLCRLNTTWPWFTGRWAEEQPTNLLNSVVEVPMPLEIVAQPRTISVGMGCDANFSVLADGIPPFNYQWQYQGTNLAGETNATLTLTNVQPSQAGAYSVVVNNATGTLVSTPANLWVAGIVGWGFDSFSLTRSNIPPGLESVVAIASGYAHDMALKPDGTVVVWGDNLANELNVPPGLTNVTAIAAGDSHSIALLVDGSVVVWGCEYCNDAWVPVGLCRSSRSVLVANTTWPLSPMVPWFPGVAYPRLRRPC